MKKVVWLMAWFFFFVLFVKLFGCGVEGDTWLPGPGGQEEYGSGITEEVGETAPVTFEVIWNTEEQ